MPPTVAARAADHIANRHSLVLSSEADIGRPTGEYDTYFVWLFARPRSDGGEWCAPTGRVTTRSTRPSSTCAKPRGPRHDGGSCGRESWGTGSLGAIYRSSRTRGGERAAQHLPVGPDSGDEVGHHLVRLIHAFLREDPRTIIRREGGPHHRGALPTTRHRDRGRRPRPPCGWTARTRTWQLRSPPS
jgi:hypothetical protein